MTDPNPTDERERARHLALDALAADDEETAFALANEALRLDPDCSDALLLRAQLDDLEDAEYVGALRHAFAAAERSLGTEFIAQHRGNLSRQEKAHAYLRARHQLALALIESDEEAEIDEATDHLQQLIDLTGDDELGCRYLLLGSWLIDADYEAAQKLLDRFPDDQTLVMQLVRAVVAFQQDRRDEAEAFLRHAQQMNRNLNSMLRRPELLSRPVEQEYVEGSPDEARHSLQVAVLPLLDDHRFKDWITRQTQTPGRNDACPCGSGRKYKNCCGKA